MQRIFVEHLLFTRHGAQAWKYMVSETSGWNQEKQGTEGAELKEAPLWETCTSLRVRASFAFAPWAPGLPYTGLALVKQIQSLSFGDTPSRVGVQLCLEEVA